MDAAFVHWLAEKRLLDNGYFRRYTFHIDMKSMNLEGRYVDAERKAHLWNR